MILDGKQIAQTIRAELREQVEAGGPITVKNLTKGKSFGTKCELSDRMRAVLLCGGLLDYTKANLK